MPTPPLPIRADSRRRRQRSPARASDGSHVEERLLQAIEQLLDRGERFATLSVDKLAREAGISRATFYVHFGDKGELVKLLMQRLTHEVVDSAGGWFRDGGAVDRQSMRMGLDGMVRTLKRHEAVLAAVDDTLARDPTVAAAHDAMMDQLCSLGRKAVARVQQGGGASPGASAQLADLLTWFIEMYCARFITRYEGEQLGGLIDLFAQVVESCLFAAPAEQKAPAGQPGRRGV